MPSTDIVNKAEEHNSGVAFDRVMMVGKIRRITLRILTAIVTALWILGELGK